MAYDPPFEVMFTIVGSLIAVGWIATFVQQGRVPTGSCCRWPSFRLRSNSPWVRSAAGAFVGSQLASLRMLPLR